MPFMGVTGYISNAKLYERCEMRKLSLPCVYGARWRMLGHVLRMIKFCIFTEENKTL